MSTNPEPRNLDHVIDAVRRSGAEIKEPVDTVEGLKRLSEQVGELEMSRKERKALQAIVKAEQKYRELAESGKLKNDVEQVKSSPKWKKYLKWALIIAAVAGLGYLAYTYFDANAIKAWISRIQGVKAGNAINTGVGSQGYGATAMRPELANAAKPVSAGGPTAAPLSVNAPTVGTGPQLPKTPPDLGGAIDKIRIKE